MQNNNLLSLFATVHTERLVLLRPQREDGPAMFVVHGDPATNLYNPFGPDPDLATKDYVPGCKIGRRMVMDIGW